MTTEQLLDIVLITFNRAPQFEKTLEMLFAPDSPVRNCDLTILDNKSTDETPQIAERYAGLHPNVKHHVNNFNVGGNANIAKALEMYGAKPYHWVICDDDVYNWEGWPEVEEAMQRGEKLICVGDRHLAKSGPKRSDPAECLQQMTFLPSIIYGPGIITDTAMRNVYDCTFALFPHLAPVVMHLNHGGSIYVIKQGIVLPGCYGNDASITRGDVKSEVFTRSRTTYLAVGFAILTGELWDRKLSKRAFKALVYGSQIGRFGFYGQTFLYLRGREGSANFHAIWLQSTFLMRCILYPLHLIQNSFLYHLLVNKRLYNAGKRLMDRLNGRARKKLQSENPI